MFEWYEAEVQTMERAWASRLPPGGAVVFYGSSSIRLWPNLAADLGTADVVNLGFGGSTLAACVWFFERLVLPYRPRSLVVYAGDNDLGDGQPPVAVIASLRALLRKVDSYCGPIPFAFISIKPSPARMLLTETIRQTNLLIRDELVQRPSSYFIDVFSAMLGSDGRPRRELFVDDGLHLSPVGYRLWAEVVLAYADVVL